MQTEFTCGIYTALYGKIGAFKWHIEVTLNQYPVAVIDSYGEQIQFTENTPQLSDADLLEILVLMNNIKRQYKQLQNIN